MEDQQPPPELPTVRSQTFGLQSAVQSIKTESALNPLIWPAVVIFSAMCIVGIYDSQLARLMFYLGAAFCALTGIAYFYFMFTNPDRLQSEKYQLEARKLDLLLDEKGVETKTIDMKPTSNTFIQKPEQ